MRATGVVVAFVALVFSLWMGLPVAPAAALTVTFNPYSAAYLATQADDVIGSLSSQVSSPFFVPYVNSSTSVDGAASASSQFDLSNNAFDISFSHATTSELFSHGLALNILYFSVDQNVGFQASGVYSAVDPFGESIVFNMYLYNETLSTYVFDSWQQSQSTPNESFTLGGSGGDFQNINVGALTGTLIAGHDYRYQVFASSQIVNGSGSSVSAIGSSSLRFVPEPGSALLAGLGLMGLSRWGRAMRGRSA